MVSTKRMFCFWICIFASFFLSFKLRKFHSENSEKKAALAWSWDQQLSIHLWHYMIANHIWIAILLWTPTNHICFSKLFSKLSVLRDFNPNFHKMLLNVAYKCYTWMESSECQPKDTKILRSDIFSMVLVLLSSERKIAAPQSDTASYIKHF